MKLPTGITFVALIYIVCPIRIHGADVGSVSESEETSAATDGIVQETEEPKEVTLSVEDQKTEGTIPPTTTIEATTTPASIVSLYRLNTPNGAACVLLSVDAIITIKYPKMLGGEREVQRFIPDEVDTSGDCSEQDDALFVMKWNSYMLSWSFSKTPGGERWYCNKVDLSFNTSEPVFEHIKKPGRILRLSTPHSHTMLFPTPVGKSYTCARDTNILLRGGNSTATLLLRNMRIQPFIFKKDEFGPEYECTPGGIGAFRDETAPIAVGSTFAIVVLVTVTGYGVYRYIKIKKVQYDTME